MRSWIAPALAAIAASGFVVITYGHAAPPKLQTPIDTANAMTQADRRSIQSDLAWTGAYNGLIDGEASNRMVTAIKSFQKDHGGKQTGVLNPQERAALADAARKLRTNVGWKHTADPVTGARIGLPAKLVPKTTTAADGTTWSSTTGTIQISLRHRKETGATTATIAARERKVAARKTDYTVVKPEFFVLSGTQSLKKFYVRGQTRGNEVHVLTILYDQATEGTMAPIVVAMSSAFDPFSERTGGPPPPPKVEYSTGLVVNADGAILVSREAVEGCTSIIVNGRGNADRIAQNEAHGLALLRIYGAAGLKPLAIGSDESKAPDVVLTGIADPDHQGGRALVTTLKATTATTGDDIALSPAPDSGFAGAPVMDATGAFAGVVRLKPAVVAGPAAAAGQSSLVSATTVREFLRAHHVATATGRSDPKAAVLRIICVRK